MNNYSGRRLFNSWYVPDFNNPIGVGGFGAVYELKSYIIPDSVTAVKIISLPKNQEEYSSRIKEIGATEQSVKAGYIEAKDALISEVRMMLKVGSFTNCVGCMAYDVIEHEGFFGWDILIQMEKLESLDEFFRKKENIYISDIVKIGIDMCRALEACKRFDIIHRDIKPANIMVMEIPGSEPIFKLSDFGVAKVLGANGTMSMTGTPDYMAPEIWRGEGDERVDIYSLGIVLYQLLNACRSPFSPDYPNTLRMTDANIARQRLMKGDEKPEPLYVIGTKLAKIVLKACAYNRDDRYDSASEMLLDLESILQQMSADHEDRLIFSAPAIGEYRPSESRLVIKIQGNSAVFNDDGNEHVVEGFTTNIDSRCVKIELSPNSNAVARGRNPGEYFMGLTPSSFIIKSLDERQQIENVIVEDGHLIINKLDSPRNQVEQSLNENTNAIDAVKEKPNDEVLMGDDYRTQYSEPRIKSKAVGKHKKKKNNTLKIILSIVTCMAVGGVSTILSSTMVGSTAMVETEMQKIVSVQDKTDLEILSDIMQADTTCSMLTDCNIEIKTKQIDKKLGNSVIFASVTGTSAYSTVTSEYTITYRLNNNAWIMDSCECTDIDAGIPDQAIVQSVIEQKDLVYTGEEKINGTECILKFSAETDDYDYAEFTDYYAVTCRFTDGEWKTVSESYNYDIATMNAAKLLGEWSGGFYAMDDEGNNNYYYVYAKIVEMDENAACVEYRVFKDNEMLSSSQITSDWTISRNEDDGKDCYISVLTATDYESVGSLCVRSNCAGNEGNDGESGIYIISNSGELYQLSTVTSTTSTSSNYSGADNSSAASQQSSAQTSSSTGDAHDILTVISTNQEPVLTTGITPKD